MQNREWDAVVIGGGAAGLSAAQMLGRARRRTLVIDGGSPRNRFAAHMHAVLGHDGIDPQALLARGRDELDRYGVHVEKGAVAGIRDEGAVLRLTRVDGTVDTARAVIIATGVRDELPPVAGLDELWGHSVLHCPYCHGFEVAGARLGVLATSPQSVHQIELVRQWSDDVTAFTGAIEPLDDELRVRWQARGIRIVPTPIVALDGAGGALRAARDADGETHAIDALFVAPAPVIDLAFADALRLARTDDPGAPVAADPRGATSHPRVWAAGNVVAPHGNVPVAMAAGSMAGAGANAALALEDGDLALARRARESAETWEQRYAERDSVWSGRVNATFADLAATLPVGRALEIGCGEGADAVWLAERGWTVTAVDVSETAIRRGAAAARDRGLAERITFFAGSGADAAPTGTFDLVSASFLHSWEPDFPRISLLRGAAARVAVGGHLLIVSHASAPPWSRHGEDGHAPRLLPPEEERALLDLDPQAWEAVLVETRTRTATGPGGEPATLEDGVLLLRRR
ncbi:thioredoxin reductase [Microbacterium sp. AG790]|uniref:bifunctional NAD(P)/FAD-dependent oxidoreductase/class I SAM-dependent methyltransferase n=1 Tax=Microbacterium sp. AG790 TaxID=2183995 RepID=UPI000EB50F21|nr:bifunctional NAD(P)/FAD-dependent oxidoreductase/class I SAM-dependent methyltransferase [Microbacterium sp. AG790]RKS93093.1 thioredoxin reductase [Microbacterium sp. AG790]